MQRIFRYTRSIDDRTKLMLKNIIASFILKGCTGIITLLLVPMTLNCLGAYNNGVWLTISAALLWIENLDIGLGNGLRNKLAEYVAKNDWHHAREAVSSTLFLLIGIIVPVMAILVSLCYWCDLYELINISKEHIENLNDIVAVSTILFASTFIMKFIGNVYLGLQLPAISNFLQTGGHPIILLGTYLMLQNNISSVMMIAVLNLGTPLMMYLIAYPYTFYIRYPKLRPSLKFFSLKISKQLMSLGVMFFICQLMSSIVFLSSNIIISKMFSPELVTPYQISYRYFCILILIFTVINAPNWTATTDAFLQNDIAWIKKATSRMNKLLVFFAIIIFLMICISKQVYSLWIGNEITIPISLTISMATYIFLMMYSLTYCYFLNGLGILRLQLICTMVGIAIYAIAILFLVNSLNSVTAISIAISLSLLPNAVCNKIQFEKIINGKALGIWKK